MEKPRHSKMYVYSVLTPAGYYIHVTSEQKQN